MSTTIESAQMGQSAMGNIASATNLAKKKSLKKQGASRFQDLWDKAEAFREDNLQLEESLEALVVQVRREIAPHEHKLALAMRQQVFKLITFSTRKSLSEWQRGTLQQWVDESMGTLHELGLVDGELMDHLARADAQALGIVIDEDSDLSVVDQVKAAIQQQFGDEQFAEASDSDDDEFNEGFDFDFDYDDEEEAAENDLKAWCEELLQAAGVNPEDERNGQAAADGYDHFDEKDESKLQDSKTLFKTLFRRAARALHPDKVTDPKEKEIREGLMTQLLEARRNQDLMSVFKLYSEHVDSDVDFSEQDLAELEEVLHRFIEMQSEKRFELITQSPMHNMCFERFYTKSPATTNRKIKQYLKNIDKRTTRMEEFTGTVTSLKSLKPFLEVRYDHMYRLSGISGPW